jgi:hypothetical protein
MNKTILPKGDYVIYNTALKRVIAVIEQEKAKEEITLYPSANVEIYKGTSEEFHKDFTEYKPKNKDKK